MEIKPKWKNIIIICLVIATIFFGANYQIQITEQAYEQGVQEGINLTQNELLRVAAGGFVDITFPLDNNTTQTERFWAETLVQQEIAKLQNTTPITATPADFPNDWDFEDLE